MLQLSFRAILKRRPPSTAPPPGLRHDEAGAVPGHGPARRRGPDKTNQRSVDGSPRAPLERHDKFCPRVAQRTDQSLSTYLSSRSGEGRCLVRFPSLSGRCVPSANTGWDWLEFRRASGALRNAASSAAHVIASRTFLSRSTRLMPTPLAGYPAV